MSQIIQQKVQVRNQKFNTVNWPLALYKWVSILPWGLRALTPIGWLPDWFIADTDVQWQFSIVFNTDALPFAWAVSGTQYYYDDTVAGGSIITTVWPKPLGIGVSWTTSEETWYIILNYKFQTQVPENVVPTPYASLALATAAATASPVTIIAEVVNAGDPSENGVYAIEPNWDTKKLDWAILANNWLNKDWNTIVLGQDVWEAGDPAKLLSNREIPMDWKNLELEASNGDRTKFDWSNWNQSIWWNNVSYNTWDWTKTNERYNTADNIYYEIMNAKSADNYWVRYVKFVQSKNGVINTWDDAVVEYLYPQDSSWNNAVIHVSRWDWYVRNLDWTINRNVNLIWHSDNWIYVLWDSWGWLSRTDYINWSGNIPPILSTATTEPMAIDIATGQLWLLPDISGTVQTLVSWGTSTPWVDFQVSNFILNFTRPASIQLNYRQNMQAFVDGFYEVKLLDNWSNIAPTFTEQTAYWIQTNPEETFMRSFSLDFIPWVHNLIMVVNTSTPVNVQAQWLIDLIYVYK